MMKMHKKGMAALPAVMIIAALVLIIGAGILGTSMVEDAVTSGDKESREAVYAAEAGIHDAIERLARNKECNNGGSPSCSSFSFAVGSASAAVTVIGSSSPKTITSVGTRNNKTRTLQAIVGIDANHKVTVTSWNEITP